MEDYLYLFPDTNLFIQCRALHALDWSPWSDFSEVHVIVSRPVQREIDNRKNGGNERIGRRARKAYQLFREIIGGEQDYKVVQESGPRVKLVLSDQSKPSPELSDILDYNKADDEIVGHMHQYRARFPERDVKLLTHDSGAMTTAKTLDLSFIPIPDDWLLGPEPSETERENRRLKERIAQLQAGPSFNVRFLDGKDCSLGEIKAEHQVYAPLSKAELAELTQRLREHLRRNTLYGLGVRSDTYQTWIGECEQILAKLHYEMQVESGGVCFTIVAANDGTRPARDALVEIVAEGNLRIRPHGEEHARFYSMMQEDRMSLPPLPKALRDFVPSGILSGLSAHGDRPRRDPNAFYYKPGPPDSPVASYTLECEQWRHGTSATHFDGELFVRQGDGEVRGALECVIHAENLATPVKAMVPVRIEVKTLSAVERASALVTDFCQST